MVLEGIDLDARLTSEEYRHRLLETQARLVDLVELAAAAGRRTLVLFEGWGASGKGGALRRVTERLSPHRYRAHALDRPTDDERAHHWMWRYWRRLPEPGCLAIFDRSWYRRVLDDRVEGRVPEGDWRRAYREINDMERQLVRGRIILLKLWLHIGKDEQLRRFEERAQDPTKAWRLAPDDWRHRERWAQYEPALEEMLRQTSTPAAPWTIIPANDKLFARARVLQAIAERLSEELE